MRYAFLLSLLFLAELSGSAQHYSEYTFTTKDGLPSAIVYSMQMRKNGELLLGTANGLSRFNGKEFTNYDMSDGLVSSSIYALHEDRNGRIWVATSQGISEFADGKFQSPKHAHGPPGWVAGFIDIDQRSYSFGTELFEFKNEQWERSGLIGRDQKCYSIVPYKDGWLFSLSTGLFFYKNKQFNVLPNVDPKKAFMLKVQNDRIFLLNANELYEYRNGSVVALHNVRYPDRIISIEIFKDRLWVFLENKGVWEFDLQKNTLRPIQDVSEHWSTIIASFQKDGIIWLGGLNGLTRISVNERQHLRTGSVYKGNRSVVSNPFRPQTLFFSAEPRPGLKSYSNDTLIDLQLHSFKGFPDGMLIDKLVFIDPDQCLAITRFAHCYKIDLKQRKIERIFNDERPVYDVANDAITKRVYISTAAKIYAFDSSMHVYDSLPFRSYAMKALKKGGLLFQADTCLLILRGQKVDTCLTALPKLGRFDLSISESIKGVIALRIRGRGIRFFERKGACLSEIARLSKADGLPTNNIYKVIFDEQGIAWLHTEAGISLLDLDHRFKHGQLPLKNLRSLPVSVNNWEYTDVGISHEQVPVLATPQGVVFFEGSTQSIVGSPPNIFISAVEIQSGSVESGRTISVSGKNDTLHLRRREAAFQVRYQAISFTNSEDVTYSYRMVAGRSNDTVWSSPVRSTAVSFLNLSPGTYKFEVRARKTNTEWSLPALITIEIKPAFWETMVFKWIAVINVILIVGFIFQLRMRKVKKEAYVRSKLSELEMKALRSQLNPHFIYNALNSIQALVAAGKQKDAMRYISKFGKLLRLILEHSEDGRTSLQKELDVNGLYIELEQLRLGFDLNLTINIADDVSVEDEKVPALIMQPVLENALWHGLTSEQENKQLSIDITANDHYLVLRIADNGKGLPEKEPVTEVAPPKKRRSFGTSLVRKRLVTYNNDNKEPMLIQDRKIYGEQGTVVTLFIRREII